MAKAFEDNKQGYRGVLELASLGLIVFASVALWTSRAELSSDPVKDTEPDEKNWEPEYPGISSPPPESRVKLGYGAVSSVAMLLALASFGVLAYLLSQLDS
jgi:hypothetical protein